MMYDDEQNEQIEEQQQPSRAKVIAKDAGKKVAREGKKVAKVAIKKAAMAIIKLFGTKFLIIAVAILLAIIILVTSIKILKLKAGKREDNDNRKYAICCI